MYKNYIISALAAVLISKNVPYFADCCPGELIAVFIGCFVPLLFFCLFCDNCVEKWHRRGRDERNLAEYIRNLR